ncbi:MAG TPA: hypothetical protein VFZ21_25260 [Gemmatimonadaceae bacterium]|jgi:hypothetical protein|nr:hypothetical protein [Gemmatimonadaceae bacterium]
MRQQITRLSPLQTAKVMAAMYGLMGFIFIPFMYFAMSRGSGDSVPGGMFLILAPLAYAAFGFVFVAIGCLLYNFVASFTGGIEVDLEPTGRDAARPMV